MEDTGRTPTATSRLWLWLVRGMAVAFALASLFVAFVVFREFLCNIPRWWSQWPTVEGFAMLLAALVCSGLPYALILWNLRRGASRDKGLFQALTIGSFWFLFGTLLLIACVFEQLAEPSAEVRKGADEMFEIAVAMAGLFTLPGFLFLIGALKASRSLSVGFLTPTEPDQPSGLLLDRIGLGGTLVLFTFAAVVLPFAVGPALGGLRSVLIEALVVAGSLPYALAFQRLHRRGPDRSALTLGCSLAVGCLTNLILGGGFYGLLASHKHPLFRSSYALAGLAFFALLALSTLIMLRNILRLRRSSATPPIEPLSWWSILVIPVSLLIFLSVLTLYSLGE